MSLRDLFDALLRHWPIAVAALLCLGVAIAAIVLLSVENSRNFHSRRDRDLSTNSSRIYILDLQNETVRHVDTMRPGDLSPVKPLSSFWARFPRAQQVRLTDWINRLLDDPEHAPLYMESEVYALLHHLYFCMLTPENVDPKKRTLHLQSYLLKHLATGRNTGKSHGLASLKEFRAFVKSKPKKGASLFFRLRYASLVKAEEPIEPLILNHVKDILYSLTGKKAILVALSGNDLLLSSWKLRHLSEALLLAQESVDAINRYLAIDGYADSVELRCAVLEHAAFHGDSEQILASGKETARLAFSDSAYIQVCQDAKADLPRLDQADYRSEVERIVQENRLSVAYRPIYSVKEEKTVAYLTRCLPNNTAFETMEGLWEYAMKTGDDKALFATIVRNTMPMFFSECPDKDAKLFFPVRFADRPYMLLQLAHLSRGKNAHIVLLYREADVRRHLNPDSPAAIVAEMGEIKAKGYEVGLLLEEGELTLPLAAYGAYDYFVCSFGFAVSSGTMDTKVRSKLHGLVERLLKFKKPIIASDVESWGDIEILVRSGMAYLSSEAFSGYSALLTPPSEKARRKIHDMKE